MCLSSFISTSVRERLGCFQFFRNFAACYVRNDAQATSVDMLLWFWRGCWVECIHHNCTVRFQVALPSGCTRYTIVIYENFFCTLYLSSSCISHFMFFHFILHILWPNEGKMLPFCGFAGLLIFFLEVLHIFQILILCVLNLFQMVYFSLYQNTL